jgi:hypothetical protein
MKQFFQDAVWFVKQIWYDFQDLWLDPEERKLDFEGRRHARQDWRLAKREYWSHVEKRYTGQHVFCCCPSREMIREGELFCLQLVKDARKRLADKGQPDPSDKELEQERNQLSYSEWMIQGNNWQVWKSEQPTQKQV